jgi:hypothetical protein
MMDEEPFRYRSLTGGTTYGEYPLDSQTLVDTKQCEELESMSALKRELNPTATRCTKDGCRIRPASGVGKPEKTPEDKRKSAESNDTSSST